MRIQLIISICFLALVINANASNEIISKERIHKSIVKAKQEQLVLSSINNPLQPLGLMKVINAITEDQINNKLCATIVTPKAIIKYAPILIKKNIKLKRSK